MSVESDKWLRKERKRRCSVTRQSRSERGGNGKWEKNITIRTRITLQKMATKYSSKSNVCVESLSPSEYVPLAHAFALIGQSAALLAATQV